MRCRFLTLVALLGCRDRAPAPTPLPPPRDGVTLIQPGVPPLQTLRYHLAKGSQTTSQLVCDVDVKTGDDSGPMPTQIIALETTVDDVLADGSARLRFRVLDASVRDRPGSQVSSEVMRTQTAALRGVVITETLAPDGAVSDAQVAAGAGPDKLGRELDELVRGIARVAMRLPAEPVGVGAIWRERRTLPEGGIQAVSEIHYTLESLTGTTLAYSSAGQSTGPLQTIEQEGVKLEVTDTRGRSAVHGSVDLSRYAIEASATSVFATTMAVIEASAGAAGAAGAGRSTIEITTRMRMSPGAAAATAAAPSAPAAPTPAVGEDPAREATPPSTGEPAAAPPGHGAHSAP